MTAVRRAVDLGIPVVLATSPGTPRSAVDQDDTVPTVSSTTMPLAAARWTLRAAEEAGFTVRRYDGENWYVPCINAAIEYEIWSNDHTPEIADPDRSTAAPNEFLCGPADDPDVRMARSTAICRWVVGRWPCATTPPCTNRFGKAVE